MLVCDVCRTLRLVVARHGGPRLGTGGAEVKSGQEVLKTTRSARWLQDLRGKAEEASRKAAGWHFGEMLKAAKGSCVPVKALEWLALTGKAVEPLGVTGKALELVLASG